MGKGYNAIENYGVIGGLNTAALISKRGSIDFLCYPDFDSPSIFASLLDKEKGGSFDIHPIERDTSYKQFYLSETNVLLTRFLSKDGVSELSDFMPIKDNPEDDGELIRKLTVIRGKQTFHVQCEPRLNYAKKKPKLKQVNDNEILIDESEKLYLRSNQPLKVDGNNIIAEFSLKMNETAVFILGRYDQLTKEDRENIQDYGLSQMNNTITYWKNWIENSKYNGKWQEQVNRSALVLKLLTSAKYGSIVAAPTFSLPENIGGKRNWDYRFVWIRDSSFIVYTLLRLGHHKEASEFVHWIEHNCHELDIPGKLRLMYDLKGHVRIDEEKLEHLEGYRQSSPVRIGNDAYKQIQLDSYGELLNAVYLFDKAGTPISNDFWQKLSLQVEWIAKNWKSKDQSIWEIRAKKKDFLLSKLMCWVCLDRGIKIANAHSFPFPAHWVETRNEIYETIFNDYWDKDLESFINYKGSTSVDASILLMPLTGFIDSHDPRWVSTLSFIEKELVSDCLIYRYKHEKLDDGLKLGEGTFTMCSFWYVECLSKAGQLDKACYYFEKLLGYSNHLGLYSEQLGLKGEFLGNFPQGYTHYGLISAALSLDEQLSQKKKDHL